MKAVQELTITVADFGSFVSLAQKLSESCAKVFYHSPMEREFRNVEDAAIGRGIPGVTKIPSFMDQDIVKQTDLYIFPDIGYGPEQQHLRGLGKPVFGSNGADEYELLRTLFVEVVESLGLPMVPTEKIKGLTALRDRLKTVNNKWIKINEFRDNMETWKHIDYAHSQPELARLEAALGGAKEWIWFVVQDDLPDATELGYDGWSVDGWFPDSSFQGYEKKNELYLGAATDYDALPEGVRLVNEKFSKVLEEYGYRNFFATEIRNFEGTPYFIDPTMRMPGQTGEQLLETMENLAEVIWMAAQGELVQPKWTADFAASATLCYKGDKAGWKIIKVPDDARRWVKLCRYGQWDGVYHFPPNPREDVGVVIGKGPTIEATIASVKENFDLIGDDSLCVHLEGFKDLLQDIQQAEKEGIEFSEQPVPEPQTVI